MKSYLVIFFLFISMISNAQCPDLIIPKSGKNIQAFVPQNWFIIDSAYSDFNQDKLKDVVLVLANEKENDENTQDYECNRPVIILQKTNNGYILSAMSKNAVLCKNCGGVFGEPFSGITLNENILNINHYAGSNWRWTKNLTFRFQHNTWQLIGISEDSFFNGDDCDDRGVGYAGQNLQEVNFSTSKMHVISTKDTQCEPYKDVWLTFKKGPFINLNNFDIDKNYFPFKNKD